VPDSGELLANDKGVHREVESERRVKANKGASGIDDMKVSNLKTIFQPLITLFS